MGKWEVDINPYQRDYLFSDKRYPALVAAIGTGKTMMLLMKVWRFCQEYPDSLALVVRKEFTDLRDSTLKDFNRYFNVTADGNKEYHFKNGSVIMFRHASEINVLKNVNLSLFAIEQAEEFETDETFTFLRDRLRRANAPIRQGIIIANTNGHNWIWRLWKNNQSNPEYHLIEATTFDNAHNLPDDFIEDLKSMEKDQPNHYRRYVLNSWEDTDNGDLLIPYHYIHEACNKTFNGSGMRILACDVARFGDDSTVLTILQKCQGGWKQVMLEGYNKQDTVFTAGKLMELRKRFFNPIIVVDDVGVGGGVTDILRSNKIQVVAYNGGMKSTSKDFFNKRSQDYWKLRQLFIDGNIQLINDNKQTEQLGSIKFKYKTSGVKAILSKDEMKKEGFSSPDYADCLKMAVSEIHKAHYHNMTGNMSMFTSPVKRKANAGIGFG